MWRTVLVLTACCLPLTTPWLRGSDAPATPATTQPATPVSELDEAFGDFKPGEAKEALGPEVVAILSGATRVETFRIRRERRHKGEPLTTAPANAEHLDGYLVTGHGEEQGEAFAAHLTAALFRDQNYSRGVMMCFEPGVALRVWKGKASVLIEICFGCSKLVATTTDAWGQTNGGSLTFNPEGFRALLKLAKEAFPDDPDLQRIKEPSP